MNLLALPAFTDNCAWMLHDSKPAISIDPGESAPVIEPCDAPRPVLAPILVTRHRIDRRARAVHRGQGGHVPP
jgi:hypothetical protein